MPSAASQSQSAETGASICRPRPVCAPMNEKIWPRAPTATAASTIRALVVAAAATTVARRPAASTMASTIVAGHTLTHAATVSSTAATPGRRPTCSTPAIAIGSATGSIRPRAIGPRQAVASSHHHAAARLVRASSTRATASSRATISSQTAG